MQWILFKFAMFAPERFDVVILISILASLFLEHSVHTNDYLRDLRRKETVTPFPTTPEKCHRITL